MNLHNRYWLVFISFIIGTICTIFFVEQFSSKELPKLDFTLTTHTNSKLEYSEISQRPTLVFFGFTGCDSICPTTLTNITLALNKLGTNANKINILFISVDQENDTPEKLASYLQNFHPNIIGLTGNSVALKQLFDNFNIYVNKIGENFDHSGYLYGFKSDGVFDKYISGIGDTEIISDYILNLINANGESKHG